MEKVFAEWKTTFCMKKIQQERGELQNGKE